LISWKPETMRPIDRSQVHPQESRIILCDRNILVHGNILALTSVLCLKLIIKVCTVQNTIFFLLLQQI